MTVPPAPVPGATGLPWGLCCPGVPEPVASRFDPAATPPAPPPVPVVPPWAERQVLLSAIQALRRELVTAANRIQAGEAVDQGRLVTALETVDDLVETYRLSRRGR